MKKFIKNHKFLTLLIIILIIMAGYKLVNKIKFQIALKNDFFGSEIMAYDEYMETLKNVPSDIEGLSQYDKYMRGLDYMDGSDTDFDGLSDKEEIEVYGTDPLKGSTAGDLYSDGYKVEHDMDVMKYYDYQDDIVFEYNECPEVLLTADEPVDFFTVVQDYTDRYSLKEYGINKIYKGYWLYNYNGEVKIDITELLRQNNLDSKDIKVWVYKGDFLVKDFSKLEKCKFSCKNNVITLKYDFDNTYAYYVYITGKMSRFSSLLSVVSDMDLKQENESADSQGVAFICGSPILEQFFGKSGHIWYTQSGNDTQNAAFLNSTLSYCNSDVLITDITSEDENKLTIADKTTVNLIATIFEKFLPMCKAKPEGEETLSNYIFNFTIYESSDYDIADSTAGGMGEEGERKYWNNYHTEFDPYVDELPFQNFASEYAPKGNCSGIAHLTTYLFNTGSIPASGEYDGISWDLTTDEANSTLMDRGLFDYKTRYFVDEHAVEGNNYNYIGDLSQGENEFAKMVAAFWKEGNDVIEMLDYLRLHGQNYDWSVAEQMMAYLDQGKILSVGMYMNGGYGHEIVLYDYYWTPSDEVIFRVYDPNIPQNDRGEYELNCDGACYLQCKKLIAKDGTETLDYFYYPVEGAYGHMASSTLMVQHALVAFDENWNTFDE